MAPDVVRDKDGISAALAISEYAAVLKAEGRTLLDALDDLARAHGVHATDQLSVRVAEAEEIGRMMRSLRSSPPATLAGAAVTSVEDLSDGVDGLPPTEGLRYRTADEARVIVRPSGTEPKLKCYLEAVARHAGDGPRNGPGAPGGASGGPQGPPAHVVADPPRNRGQVGDQRPDVELGRGRES